MEQIIQRGIEAVLPVYIKDRGNCTAIYTGEGEIILEKTIKTTISNLCRYYHLDLKASNESYGNLLSIKKYPPIPFSHDQIFIPIKVRIPIGKHDGAYGFVNINSIEKVAKSKSQDKCILYLSNKRTIDIYSKDSTIQRNINNGIIVKRLLDKRDLSLIKEEESLYEAENALATKKDIAMVYKEIMRIKGAL